MELVLAHVTAFWLGILTSITPCPLATNIAAVSYIGRRVDSPRSVLWAGGLYALGRTLSYVGLAVIVVSSVMSMTEVSVFLQKHMNRLLGPILIVAGMFLLELLTLSLPAMGIGARMQKRVESWGIWGACALGMLFALSFCPVSAAMYFGSLIPISLRYESRFTLPFVYGIGTALPVLAVAVALGLGARYIGTVFDKLTAIERWARTITGVVFIIVGIYYTLIYIFGFSF